MAMKNRPEAANHEGGTFDNSSVKSAYQQASRSPKRTPKKHRAFVYIVSSGVNGVTENEILRQCYLASGRNYISELENALDIVFERLDEANPDGIGKHFRYRLTNRMDAMKVIQHINHMSAINQHRGLNQQDITDILNLYPDNQNAA